MQSSMTFKLRGATGRVLIDCERNAEQRGIPRVPGLDPGRRLHRHEGIGTKPPNWWTFGGDDWQPLALDAVV
jgi:hypothetical protein